VLELRLRYEGNGTFQTAGRRDWELVGAELESGAVLRARIWRPRSVRQNDFFHALIEAAFESQRGGPRLPSWRHLKAYLLIQAGHCEDVRLRLGRRQTEGEAVTMAGTLAGALRRRFDTTWVTYDRRRREIVMRFAKSVSFREVDGERMGEITDRIVDLIAREIVPGATPEEIMGEAKRRAA
jgi:hypothetical protein